MRLQSLRDGDQAAWEELILDCQDRIFNYLFHLDGSYHEALDLTQETFLKAWRGIKTFKEGEDFLPWIYAIARNTWLEKLRRKKLNQFSLDEALETGFEPESASNPLNKAEKNQESERLRLALLQIPSEFRTAVVLRFMEDLSYEEIAQIEGIALGTAKSRVFRGKELLSKALKGRIWT